MDFLRRMWKRLFGKKETLEERKQDLAASSQIAEKAVDDARRAWSSECSKAEKEKKLKEYAGLIRTDNESDPAAFLRILLLKLQRTRERIIGNDLTMSSKRNGKQIARVEKLILHALAGKKPCRPLRVFRDEEAVAAYSEFLKDDSDSDFDSILYLLSFRCQRMAALQNAPKDRMLLDAADLFRKVADDEYESVALRGMKEKYGELQMDEEEPDDLGMIPIDLRYEKETPDNSEQVRQDFLAAIALAESRRHGDLQAAFGILLAEMFDGWDRWRAIGTAFRLMDRHMFGWWD